jgi:PAS domain S-box-containing protein
VSYFDEYPLSWQHLLEVLPDGVLFVDGEGTIHFANQRIATMTGYEVNGKSPTIPDYSR